jgi:protein ImuB
MRRVISLFLPRWPSDRLRRLKRDAPPRDSPLVTAMMEGQRRILASVVEAAERLGLCCGMTVTHAQSLVPELTVIDATPDADDAALHRLAIWCVMYSPLVTPDPPDGIFIDVAGSAHLFHGEAALLDDLCMRLSKAGIAAKAAISDTPGCSWGVARYSDATHVSPGRASEAIASLPVAALRLAPQIVDSLHDVGIERVAHLASKPRASLQLRFGSEVLLRLDQALGCAAEALPSLMPPEVPGTELRFAELLGDPEDLKRVIEKLCADLCVKLEARGIGARRLDLVFTLSGVLSLRHFRLARWCSLSLGGWWPKTPARRISTCSGRAAAAGRTMVRSPAAPSPIPLHFSDIPVRGDDGARAIGANSMRPLWSYGVDGTP